MRAKSKLFAKILFVAVVFTFSACQKSVVESASVSPSSFIASTPAATPTATPDLSSPIQKLDFKNFEYPWVYLNNSGLTYIEVKKDPDLAYFVLKNGKLGRTETKDGATLQKVEFIDVTDDGEKEAIVKIYPETGGNCSCDMVYIYGYLNQKLKLLWAFGTYDRAEGGLKSIYAENGNLVVELFGDSKFENGKWNFRIPEGKFKGLCCPTVYTKSRFSWNGKKFVSQGAPEMFDYDWKKKRIVKN